MLFQCRRIRSNCDLPSLCFLLLLNDESMKITLGGEFFRRARGARRPVYPGCVATGFLISKRGFPQKGEFPSDLDPANGCAPRSSIGSSSVIVRASRVSEVASSAMLPDSE